MELSNLSLKYNHHSQTNEKVDAGESDEGRAGDGEEEAGRVHQGHRGVAVEQHEQYERSQILTGHVGLRAEHEEDDDAEPGRQAVHHEVPEEHGHPVHAGRHPGDKVEMLDVPHSLLGK